MCLFLWQANIYPVLGLGSETITNANKGLNTNSIATTKIVVQRGETLWDLAQRYQTTVDQLVKLNGVKSPDQIREGQSLWVPTPVTKKRSEDLKTMDVKEFTDKILITSAQAKAAEREQVAAEDDKAYTPWWVSVLRSIPVFAKTHQEGYTTADLSNLLPTTGSKIKTYEIFVNQDNQLPQKLTISPLPPTKNDSQTLETPKADSAVSSESQIHSRGLGRLVSEQEIELLSRVIYGEARGEDFMGQVAVGAVVLNRLKDPRFPKTIKGIVYQSGAFTAVNDRQIHLDPNDQAYKAAEAALSGLDPTNGAIFYYNPKTATDQWIKSRTVIKRIGNHTFSI
ncbi:cell wall hydrolase [Desulfosporosinus nitroreducens]|uniref:cell wall hydrolase n=1 Tax=Desulfosporosinus nitroreducens TaxID=2018668 RepID=UPI00207D36AF|nr:cell wall hydrolase [Desulfosporosinus nitroreducens]MCO1603172.1 cell wall hydrolase [Desulfosporosinus nitroreducens]